MGILTLLIYRFTTRIWYNDSDDGRQWSLFHSVTLLGRNLIAFHSERSNYNYQSNLIASLNGTTARGFIEWWSCCCCLVIIVSFYPRRVAQCQDEEVEGYSEMVERD